MLSHEWWVYALAALTSSVAVGRIVRLLVFDDFPPAKALRDWWITKLTKGGPWSKIFKCGFCMAVYLVPLSWAWAWISNLHWTWWAAHLLVACMYLAAIIVAYDQPE